MKKTIALLSMILVIAEAKAADQLVSSPVSYSSNVLQMLLGLAAIVAMIIGLVWLLKKVGYKGYGVSDAITVKSCLPLSTKEKLLLVEVGGEQILIGVAPGVISHIKTLEHAVDDSKDNNNLPSSSLFSEKLKAMINSNTIK